MKRETKILCGMSWIVLWGLLVAAAAQPVYAEETSEEDRLAVVEEKVEALTDEVGRLESIFAVPEELALESFSGLGPAASKVYKRDAGLSIGGYGEVRLRSYHDQGRDNKNDVFDALRAVLYVGYKFDDNWVFNSELEFEHGGGDGGSVSTEFATIDYLHSDEFNVRAGLLLVPMGFVNEIHEPNFFFGAERPEVERVILPSTWRENGVGIFGRVADRVDYRFYVINGFDGSGFSKSGLRGGRQKGSKALSNDFAFVGRVDVDVAPGLLLGGSVYVGQSGQEQRTGTDMDPLTVDGELLPDMMTQIYEFHGQYKGNGLSLRALWTEAFVDEAGAHDRILNSGLGSRMRGWYAEAAFDVLSFAETRATLEPFFRFEQYDTQYKTQTSVTRDRFRDINLYVAGLQFKPIPQVVFKVDYRHFDPRGSGHRANEVQALVGYAF